jgi:hypothetical protein
MLVTGTGTGQRGTGQVRQERAGAWCSTGAGLARQGQGGLGPGHRGMVAARLAWAACAPLLHGPLVLHSCMGRFCSTPAWATPSRATPAGLLRHGLRLPRYCTAWGMQGRALGMVARNAAWPRSVPRAGCTQDCSGPAVTCKRSGPLARDLNRLGTRGQRDKGTRGPCSKLAAGSAAAKPSAHCPVATEGWWLAWHGSRAHGPDAGKQCNSPWSS